ncbi:hypothetical protein ACMFMG_005905 [Clarireedia jacksonii]
MHSPLLTHRISKYSYTSSASLAPSNLELWFCDDLDCNPPYGPLCADCRPRCAELREARNDNESVSTYWPDPPAVSRPKKSKDNLFDPDVYLDEEEVVQEDPKRSVQSLEEGEDKLIMPEVDQVQKDIRVPIGLKGCLEKSLHYLQHNRWSIGHFGGKLKEAQAVAKQTQPQQPEGETTRAIEWPQLQEYEYISPQVYTRIPEADASEVATQFLYYGQQQSSAIIEDEYPGPFSSLMQSEEKEDQRVTEKMHREWLHKWLEELSEGPFAADESDHASSTCASLYSPFAAGQEHEEIIQYTLGPERGTEQVDERFSYR